MDRSSWWTRRAWGLHLTLLVTVPAFLALCWWQVDRALSGNGLSWAYVFEWPFFAAYAVYMWWKLVHEPPVTGRRQPSAPGDGARGRTGAQRTERTEVGRAGVGTWGGATGADDGSDEELAAYNRYLSALDASGRRKHW